MSRTISGLVAGVAFAVAACGGRSAVLVVVAVVVLDVAVQGVNILDQSRAMSLSHEARSRLDTAFVTCNFLGGTVGPAAATVLWSWGGWAAVTVAGMAASCVALEVWPVGRRGPLLVSR